MATRIAQRLIAAGASPERAAAFERQFAAARPGLKPRELQDAFDTELGAISQSIWPNTFRPPSVEDPAIDDYIRGIYGEEELDRIDLKAWETKAPRTWKVAQTLGDNPPKPTLDKGLDAYIVWNLLYGGKSVGDLQNELQTEESLALTGNLLPSDVNSLVNTYAREVAGIEATQRAARRSFLNNDKYYKAGLPHPKLKYGETTDLAKGIIDYRTNPTVQRVLQDPKEFENFSKKRTATVERARGLATRAGDALSRRELIGIESQDPVKLFEEDVAKSFLGSYKGTPFFDEVKRRESVKGKTIK